MIVFFYELFMLLFALIYKSSVDVGYINLLPDIQDVHRPIISKRSFIITVFQCYIVFADAS